MGMKFTRFNSGNGFVNFFVILLNADTGIFFFSIIKLEDVLK